MLDVQGYLFFDGDGTMHVVDIATEQPEVYHACINVSEDESVVITMLLPIDPVMADTPTSLGTVSKIGVALDEFRSLQRHRQFSKPAIFLRSISAAGM